MDYKDAEELLPRFAILLGMRSTTYEKKISDLFVGYVDARLTGQMYKSSKRVKGFTGLPNDAGQYTLCVSFEDGSLHSVKNIVVQDTLLDLYQDAEALEEMLIKEHGSAPNKGISAL